MFIKKYCNWTEFRKLPNLMEVDFHNVQNKDISTYLEKMDAVWYETLHSLKHAQEKGFHYVLFTHGHSTSYPGTKTSRSQVRSVMKSKEATPYIIRKDCIQHDSVFVAKIRPLKNITE